MTGSTRLSLVLTCEHATCSVPARYRPLFRGHSRTLQSHRGWDPGSPKIGRAMACKFNEPLMTTDISRLLVEVNRSLHHPRLFSEFSQQLSQDEQAELLSTYYFPYRQQVQSRIGKRIKSGLRVLHLSIHTFTPELDGVVRAADVGLLYDPSRTREQRFCRRWQQVMKALQPDRIVRRNYPYRGASDGLTTHLRRLFAEDDYLGIELEVNQKHFTPPAREAGKITNWLVRSLAEVMTKPPR